jgi:hypothetical protein
LALAQHLENSRTGFARTHYDVRSDADLAAAVGVNLRTVRRWLNPNGKLLPANIDKILEVLFGDHPKLAAGANGFKALWARAVDAVKEAQSRKREFVTHNYDSLLETNVFSATAPSIGSGSQFSPTAAGYEILAAGMSYAERTDPIQTRLYIQIQRRLGQLTPLLASIGDSHPFLASEIADYMALVSVDLDELDVPAVWSAGSALREMLAQLTNPNGSMTPALEPEPLAMLNSLMRDDIAFIQGFAAGRALTQRVRDFQQSGKPVEPTRRASRDVVCNRRLPAS